jgi:hypothetical protein
MRQVFIGVALVIAGIAAFIEAGSHEPRYEQRCVPPACEVVAGEGTEGRGERVQGGGTRHPQGPETNVLVSGLSHTAHDLLRIAAWALVLIGGTLMLMGFIRYWRAQASP